MHSGSQVRKADDIRTKETRYVLIEVKNGLQIRLMHRISKIVEHNSRLLINFNLYRQKD